MQAASLFYFLGVIIFVFFAGLFSSLETAFVCTDHLKLKQLKTARPKTYKALSRLFTRPEHFLATTLVGTNLCIVTSSSLLTLALVTLGIENASFWVAMTLTPFVLLFGEMLPKSLGRVFQVKLILYWLSFFRFLAFILRPLVAVIEFFPLRIIRFFFKDTKHTLSKDDLKILTETLHSQGSIERVEKEAIVDALGFSHDRIKDVFVPLKKTVGLDYIDNRQTILAKAGRFGFTRYPVFRNKEIIGYLNIFDLFYKEGESWHKLIRPIVKVGINQRLDDVLALLRRKKENIAVVFKGRRAYGIVSTQDIIREVISALTHS